MATEAEIREKLKQVVDPEIGYDIISLGLVYSIRVDSESNEAHIEMTLTTPLCPYGPMLLEDVREKVEELGVKADIEVVFEPPWSPDRVEPEVRKKLGL